MTDNTDNRFNFTKKALDTLPLPPKGKRAYYYDTKTHGLGVAITGNGVKTFIVYRKIQGRPERITLGRYPDLTIEKARGKAGEVNAAIADKRNPQDEKRAARAEMPLSELHTLFMERHAKVHKKSWAGDQAQFDRYLSHWKGRQLSQIRKRDIQALHAQVGQEHGPYAANRLLALLRVMFNKANEWGWEHPNPAQGVKPFREKSRERFLQADELPRFFKAAADEPNDTARDYILMSLLTGARQANVLAMRWEDVNLERATWTIPETKNGTAHTVPLVPVAIEILQARKNKSPWVFPGDGKTGHLVEPKKAWARILERAELYGLVDMLATAKEWDAEQIKTVTAQGLANPKKALPKLRQEATEAELNPDAVKLADLRVHDLRRSLGSWQAATGASLSVIGKTLAHKNVSTTAIYARLNLDPVREAMNKAATAMLEAGRLMPKAEVVSLKK